MSALDLLVRFDWPGNVRELQNEIERAVTLANDGEKIGRAHLSSKLGAGVGEPGGTWASPEKQETDPGKTVTVDGKASVAESDPVPRSLRKARAAFEARHIAETLREQGGNVSRAAEALGLSRVMLQKKMKEYGLR